MKDNHIKTDDLGRLERNNLDQHAIAPATETESGAMGAISRAGGGTAKIVLFLDHTAAMGGGELALLRLICALDKKRYRPIVALAAEGPLAVKLRDAGVETYVIPLNAAVLSTRKDSLSFASLLRSGEAWACVQYAFCLAVLARHLSVDLIHTNSLKSDLYGGLAGRLAHIPVIWHIRDTIDRHYLSRPVAAAFRALAAVIPHAVIANSEHTLCILRLPRRKPATFLYSGLAGLKPAQQGTYVLPGTPTYSTGLSARTKPPVENNPATNPRLRAENPRVKTESRVATISLVGRIAQWKGQHIFIQAAVEVCRAFPGTRFQIIGAPLFGEHDYELSLHNLAERLGLLKTIKFLGFRDDVMELLEETDILVHASILAEPFGQVVVEGMAAGKPVVATEGGALREIVVPGITGLLVPCGDASAMAEAIIALLRDPAQAQKMGIAGRQRVQERFLISQTADKMHAFYDQFLNSN